MIQASKIIGTGLATTGLIGAGVEIGVVFGCLILGVARNPSIRGQLFSYAILGFAFSEATGLFALMMAFLLLFVTFYYNNRIEKKNNLSDYPINKNIHKSTNTNGLPPKKPNKFILFIKNLISKIFTWKFLGLCILMLIISLLFKNLFLILSKNYIILIGLIWSAPEIIAKLGNIHFMTMGGDDVPVRGGSNPTSSGGGGGNSSNNPRPNKDPSTNNSNPDSSSSSDSDSDKNISKKRKRDSDSDSDSDKNISKKRKRDSDSDSDSDKNISKKRKRAEEEDESQYISDSQAKDKDPDPKRPKKKARHQIQSDEDQKITNQKVYTSLELRRAHRELESKKLIAHLKRLGINTEEEERAEFSSDLDSCYDDELTMEKRIQKAGQKVLDGLKKTTFYDDLKTLEKDSNTSRLEIIQGVRRILDNRRLEDVKVWFRETQDGKMLAVIVPESITPLVRRIVDFQEGMNWEWGLSRRTRRAIRVQAMQQVTQQVKDTIDASTIREELLDYFLPLHKQRNKAFNEGFAKILELSGLKREHFTSTTDTEGNVTIGLNVEAIGQHKLDVHAEKKQNIDRK